MAKDASPPWPTRRGHLARRWFSDPVLWTTTALVALAFGLPRAQGLFAALFPQQERPVYLQEPFTELLWQHLLLVVASSSMAALIGSLVGVAVTRGAGRVFKPLAQSLATAGQTFHPLRSWRWPCRPSGSVNAQR